MFHGRGPCGSHTSETDCAGPDFPHGRGPFKIEVVPDEEEKPVIGDVEGGELERFLFLFWMFLGALLTLTLASFLFGLALCGSFAALGSYHHCL